MLKPATVRVNEDFLKEISSFIKDMKLDKSSYLRDILKKGFEEDKEERLLSKYQTGELSAEEVYKTLGKTPWDFFELLRHRNAILSVTLEDWLDSAKIC